MAIYKSTYCYPFLTAVDIRVGNEYSDSSDSSDFPAEYLKCRVESSNKSVTGFKLRLLDEQNNQVFPLFLEDTKLISPIEELQEDKMASIYSSTGINSGINGTYLQIPFIQNGPNKATLSYNAIYYKPRFKVDRIILSTTLGQSVGTVSMAGDISRWTKGTDSEGKTILTYNWPSIENVDVFELDGTFVTMPHQLFSLSYDRSVVYYATTDKEAKKLDADYNSTYNRIRIDGELIEDGDIIAIISDSAADADKVGFYYADKIQTSTSSVTSSYTTVLRPIDDWNGRFNNDEQIAFTVTKGDVFHNTVWRNVENKSKVFEIWPTSGDDAESLWYVYGQDVNNNNETVQRDLDLYLDGTMYKWEITLYQGDNTIIENSGLKESPRNCTYSNVSVRDYDMLVNSGTILGSNTERIQIARDDPFTGEYVNTYATLPALKQGVLVLQTRYMSFSATTPSDIITSNRVYVQSYDSSYGHVYPMSGTVTQTTIDSSNYVQFFKHSNDIDSILDTDIVQFGDSQEIDLKFIRLTSAGATYFADETEWINNTSITERKIAVKWSGVSGLDDGSSLPSIILSSLQSGQMLLLAGQTAAYRNGVYTYSEVTSGNVTLGILTRASSYNSWADYIGKIIFCQNYITNAQNNMSALNIESLATSGTTCTLWNPLENSSVGGTNLLFTSEIPILLFESEIKEKRTYDVLYVYNDTVVPSVIVDNATLTVGDIILASHPISGGAEVKVYTYNGVDVEGNPVWTENTDQDWIPESGDFCYINKGQSYGKRTVYYSGSSIPLVNWSLYTGKILKNTQSHTFISPFTNVQAGMRMTFTKNHQIKWLNDQGDYETHNYVNIAEVNSNLYCILHNTLDTALTSTVSNENNTPWTYTILSYFKTSDENPFYSYMTPYGIIYKNDLEYTGLANSANDKYFYVLSEAEVAQMYEVVRQIGTSTTNVPFVCQISRDAAQVYGRSVKMSAKYVQFEDGDWESYRWVLTDSSGNILQDTGKHYDQELAAYFYGLANDQNVTYTIYYAILYLEDDLNNILSFVVPLQVASDVQENTSIPFTATCVPELHAVHITYDPSGLSGYDKFSLYRREYEVYQNPGLKVNGYYYNGAFYSDPEHTSLLTPRENILYVDQTTQYYYQYNSQLGVYSLTPRARVYKGQWQPVITNTTAMDFYDYNVQNGHSYQYIIYPVDSEQGTGETSTIVQVYANSSSTDFIWVEDETYSGQGKSVNGGVTYASQTGAPVALNWENWSIAELTALDSDDEDLPIVNDIYTIDPEQVWLFKYSLETGSQTQNISRNEFQTLGVYPKVGFGKSNYLSGEVTALLGSEIIPYSKQRYIERVKASRTSALTTNEKSYMLDQWRKFVASSNPKLLTDMKGNAWIVHIMSGSSTTKNGYINYPDTISFQWKQVESVENVEIYGDIDNSTDEINDYGKTQWEAFFKNKLFESNS